MNTSANATSPTPSSLSRHNCRPSTFPVPLFEPGEYPRKSQQAHAVLGILLLLMVIVWCTHVTQFSTPLKKLHTAYKSSGVLQILMGVYLLSWCFVFLKPTHLSELYRYSTKDLLQIQHITISCCAICCGLTSIGWARND